MNKLYSKVFMWLFVGLLITYFLGFGLQFVIMNNPTIASLLFKGPGFIIIIILEIIVALILSIRIAKMNSTLVKILYILYCALTGVTFSTIFMLFELSSIIFIFLVTGVIFGIFAIIGAKLDVDLTKFGTYLFIALIGVVIVEIINIFIGSSTLDMILSAVAILIFTLYIGYDIKKVQDMSDQGMEDDNVAVYGAFQLFLDFINIFIRLLQFFGKLKD